MAYFFFLFFHQKKKKKKKLYKNLYNKKKKKNLESHIFIPTDSPEIYHTLNKREIFVKDQILETGKGRKKKKNKKQKKNKKKKKGFEEKRDAKILFSETHYDDNFNPIRTVLISKPLAGKIKV